VRFEGEINKGKAWCASENVAVWFGT
jgi:hypothetical protein